MSRISLVLSLPVKPIEGAPYKKDDMRIVRPTHARVRQRRHYIPLLSHAFPILAAILPNEVSAQPKGGRPISINFLTRVNKNTPEVQ